MSKQAYQPVPNYAEPSAPQSSAYAQPAIYFAQPTQQTGLLTQWVPPQPIPGLEMRPPRVDPVAGQVILAFEPSEPEVGLFKCSDLHIGGIVSVIVIFLVFWPLAWLPCCMSECHHKCQRPVYGFPPSPPSMTPPPHLVLQAPQGGPAYF